MVCRAGRHLPRPPEPHPSVRPLDSCEIDSHAVSVAKAAVDDLSRIDEHRGVRNRAARAENGRWARRAGHGRTVASRDTSPDRAYHHGLPRLETLDHAGERSARALLSAPHFEAGGENRSQHQSAEPRRPVWNLHGCEGSVAVTPSFGSAPHRIADAPGQERGGECE